MDAPTEVVRPGKESKVDKALSKSFLCPILQELMSDPVVAADGHSYERAAIVRWIETRGARALSPMTGEQLNHLELTPNVTLRTVIGHYKETLPRRRELELTEQTLSLAIKLREEELSSMLAKQERQLSQVIEAKTSVERQLGPLAQENQRLSQQNRQQQLEIERLRREIAELQQGRDAPVSAAKSSLQTPTTAQLIPVQRDREAAQAIALSANERVNQKAQSVSGRIRKEEITELLNYTIRGQLAEVRQCLNRNRDLVHAQGDVTDLSDRTFLKITGFQYAIWSGDEELWNVFLEFISQPEAYDQLMALINERSDITETHGAPLSFFEPLLTAYKRYRDNVDEWDWPQCEAGWNREVGGAQRNMPAWFMCVFSEEGEDKAWPTKQMTRAFSLQRDDMCSVVQEWLTEEWGTTCAFLRGDNSTLVCVDGGPPEGWPWLHDLENSTKLKTLCTQKFTALTERLERASRAREAAKPQRVAAVLGTKGIFPAPRIASSANERVNQKAQNVSGLMREEEITELLNYTIRGQLDEVRQCLRRNRDLVYARGDVIDLSGRYFQNITGFQYAVWSGDEELWNVFPEFLSEIDAYNQLMALTKESSDIRQTHGSPLSFFEPLLTAYQGYLDNYAARSDAQRTACWQKEVGGAQRNMPSWFIYVFSEEGADKAWPAKKMTSGFTRNGDHLKTWFEQEYNNGKCGVTFAFYRAGRGSGGRGGMSRAHMLSACADAGELDLKNTITLKRECTKKLAALTKRLERASKTALNTSSTMANRK